MWCYADILMIAEMSFAKLTLQSLIYRYNTQTWYDQSAKPKRGLQMLIFLLSIDFSFAHLQLF